VKETKEIPNDETYKWQMNLIAPAQFHAAAENQERARKKKPHKCGVMKA
jgi:hypothetical protein